MSVNLEHERPAIGEVVYGRHEQAEVGVDDLVMLPQVRPDLNPILPELKNSIQMNGLINPIDVARLDEESLSKYIGFVNRVWKTDTSIEAYEQSRQPDGTFYLVIAGHSRTEAIRQLAQEHPDVSHHVVVKVHDCASPAEIISLQLSENIHSTPPKERQAIAVVETYEWGIEEKMWTSKADFLRQKKISRGALNDALHFADLPTGARDFILSGVIPYAAGIELGKGSAVIKEYSKLQLGKEDGTPEVSDVFKEQLDEAYRYKIGFLIQNVFAKRLKGNAARQYIAGHIANMQEIIEQENGSGAQPELFVLRPPGGQYLSTLRRDLAEALRATEDLASDSIRRAALLQQRLIGDAAAERMIAEYEKQRMCQLGGLATKGLATEERLSAD